MGLCYTKPRIFVKTEREGDGCIVRMRFGFHRNPEYGVALLFNEWRKADVFATDGDDRMVGELEIGEIRFGIRI